MIRAITPLLATAPYDEGVDTPGVSVVDVRALLDKSGNQPDFILERIGEGVDLLKQGRRVIVCCDYGMSRSNAIAAGILSKAEAIPVTTAIQRVIQATGETEIKFEMIHAVSRALGQLPQSAKTVTTKVLVTGATGDIGRYVRPRLQETFPTRGLSSADLDLRAGTQQLGLLCLEEQFTHVLHLASPRVISTNRGVGEEITILKNVADVARTLGIKLVYLSSSQVFLGSAGPEPVLADESHPVAPAGYIGHAKALGERLLSDMQVDACILRFGQVYGPGFGKPRFLRYFIDRLRQDLPVVTHRFENGAPCVDLVHASDLAAAIAFSIATDVTGLHHVGRGETVYPRDIVGVLKGELNSASRVESRQMEGRGNTTILAAHTFSPAVALSDGLKDLLKRTTQ